ncbi:HEPN domain-containing protein [Conexibacter woesei]|uniref:HEPN domain protein n=1 Tax=Conexibacter woesei (strain DSM 14684 / CCUG 47730 / CIP 108061 / JCM 11494 / NBRC 100937 / ID131577) TaxID=469383 RepID=D3F3L3_CONWI|nr:HEPN domain-containing protein [Conexibacter woesei]ADB52378.1 HEPN domain protein [Conexibacter woesei DSM 14684]
MPAPEQVEAARLLLRKARADLAAVRALADSEGQDDGVIGFHAQQAVEKAFKAVLAAREFDVPRTHDISFLLRQLAKVGNAAPAPLTDARWLSPWAVTTRYDEVEDEPLDRSEAVELAASAVGWASTVVDRLP